MIKIGAAVISGVISPDLMCAVFFAPKGCRLDGGKRVKEEE